ncbi:MAG: hypothetical protein BGO78_11125 [Chloroflexi bacterium 44-23]|nr:MAG: hypothetical protein BGO78_11125 [Chloroflexi bacterium 44-23]
MILARVIGTVVTTISHPDLKNRRLLTVQPLQWEGEPEEAYFLALDNTHAGVGDTVIVNQEGNGNRQALQNPGGCINSVIVAIVDSVFID